MHRLCLALLALALVGLPVRPTAHAMPSIPAFGAAPAAAVGVSPAVETLAPGDQALFSAAGGAVTGWSVASGGGTVTADGLYTAPPISATVTLRATTASGSADAQVLVRSWAPLDDAPLPADTLVSALRFGPDGVLYAATDGRGVYRLDPRQGSFWRPMRGDDGSLPEGGMRVREMAFDADGDQFIATQGGVFRRQAGRSAWERLTNGIPEAEARAAAEAIVFGAGTIVAGFEDGFVRRWDARASRWVQLANRPTDRPIYALAFDGRRLFAGSNGVVFQHPDVTNPDLPWQQAGPPVNELATSLAVFEGRLYAGVRNRGLLVLDGNTWRESRRHAGAPLVAGGKLFAQGSGLTGANVLRLDGTSWVNATPDNGGISGSSGADAFAVSPEGALVIARRDGTYRSARGLAFPVPATSAERVALNASTLTIRVGTNGQLSASTSAARALPQRQFTLFLPLLATGRGGTPPAGGGVFWHTSDAAIATVDSRGTLTGIAPGTATITAIARDNPAARASAVVTVVAPVARVSAVRIIAPATSMEAGRALALYAELQGEDLGDQAGVSWESSNPAVATVGTDGVVRGVNPGSATITARARADASKSDSLALTVAPSTVAALPTGGRWQNLTAGLPPNPKNPQAGPWITAITVHQGRLIVGIEGQEVWARDGNGWVRIAAPGSLGPLQPKIDGFAHDSAGALHALADRGVFRYQADNNWANVSTGLPQGVGLSQLTLADGVLHLLAENDNDVRLFRLVNGQWQQRGQPLTAPRPAGGFVFAAGSFYLGMRDGNVYRLESNGSWSDYSANLPDVRSESNPGGINAPDVGIAQLQADENGTLWVVTDRARNKLFRRAPGAPSWEPLHRYEYGQGASNASSWIGGALFLGGERKVVRFSGTSRLSLGAAYNSAPDMRVLAIFSPDGGQTIYAAGDGPVGSAVWWITPDPLAPVQNSDLAVSTATYLGTSPGADDTTAVDLGVDGALVVAGRSESPDDYGLAPTLLLGGGEGVLTRFDPSGRQVLSRTRLGQRILDMELDRVSGRIAIASDLGVSLLSASADRIIWHVPLAGVSRVAATNDGHVAALQGKTVLLFDPSGRELSRTTVEKSFVNDVALDAATRSVYATGTHNQFLPSGEPVQVAFVYAFGYDLNFKWKSWDYPGAELTGDEADTRGYRVAMGRDGMLYFLGETAGGNTIFRWQSRQRGVDGNLIDYDLYSSGVNSRSAHFGYFARLDPATGAVLAGQFAVPRLPDGLSNSFRVRAIAADERGTVYLGGRAAFAIENRDANRIAGQLVAPYSGGDGALLVVSPDFRTRLAWTTWAAGGPNHATTINAVVAGRGVAAIGASAAGGRLLVHRPLPGGQQPDASLAEHNPDGFLSTWATVP